MIVSVRDKMKIVFNAIRCGLGNNGGTRTIVKSAKVLRLLGVDAYILAKANQYTWDEIVGEIYEVYQSEIKDLQTIPFGNFRLNS